MSDSQQEHELMNYISTQNDRQYHIWERRPKWIAITNTLILEQKLDYIHNNPIQEKWQLEILAEDYTWSSASYYIQNKSPFTFITHYMD